eukprot:TRINITY_DN111194_c0_g1_i1.p1 TRINITY_DN111194_c0_g1~~TRINITY_DN111194_c0_g1_i1.p1  ORF type:complete len:576 (-),score=134.88 TRINITY_DN111194_c0_g1_i1:296-2023(-)
MAANGDGHDLRSGTMKVNSGTCGFIKQDCGEPDVFTMPSECPGFFGQLPAVGTRVLYAVGMDPKKGLPRAERVQPVDGQAMMAAKAGFLSESSLSGGRQSGTIKQNSGRFGFILQDNGEKDMFVMPVQCKACGGVIPPVGFRVTYLVGRDPKSGNQRAEEVEPEPVNAETALLAGSAVPASIGMLLHQQKPQSGMMVKPQSIGENGGIVKSNNGTAGLIEQDNGEPDLFVLPDMCEGYGGLLPPVGARVVYTVGIDQLKGTPRAENVQAEEDFAARTSTRLWTVEETEIGGLNGDDSGEGWDDLPVAKPKKEKKPKEKAAIYSNPERRTGIMKGHGGKSGFIRQDCGEPDLFVLPSECPAFDYLLPPAHSRVVYLSGMDPKKQLPRAEQVSPENPDDLWQPPSDDEDWDEEWEGGWDGNWQGGQDGGSSGSGMWGMDGYGMGGFGMGGDGGMPGVDHRFPIPPAINGVSIAAQMAGTAGPGDQTGVVKQNSEKSGFIQQDSGQPDIFVLPFQCKAFNSEIPAEGSRVVYRIGNDQKSGRLRAENVRPEERQASMSGLRDSKGKGKGRDDGPYGKG